MRPQLTVIFVTDRGPWSVGLVEDQAPAVVQLETGDDPDTATSLAQQVAGLTKLLDELGVRSRTAVLALPSTWCTAAPLSTEGLLRRGRHAALLYRFEEQLPLDAEDVAADFVESPGVSLGICCQVRQVAPSIDVVEEAGINIGSVCPTAMLALSGHLSRGEGDAAIHLLQHAGRVECFATASGRPRAWYSLAATVEAVTRQMRYHQLWQAEPLQLAAVGLEPPLLEALQTLADVGHVEVSDAATDELATAAAAEVVLHGRRAPVELRRGALAPRNPLARVRQPLIAAATALVLLLAGIAGASFWRAEGYQRLTLDQRDQQALVFRSALPGQRVPAAPLPRLRSEADRVAGAHGLGASGLPERPSALHLLHTTLEGLSRDLRYRVLDLRLDGRQLYIDGQARSHTEADRITASLRQSLEGFDLAPPRTEHLPERGVSFTIMGQRQGGMP